MAVSITQQAAVFVRKDGRTDLAYWLAFRIGDRLRTLVAVLAPEQVLLPRDKIGLKFRDSAFDVRYEELRAWLVDRGYELVGRVVDAEV